MCRLALSFALVAAVSVWPGPAPLARSKSRTPLTSTVKALEMSPQELRLRVRALIRPTLGIIEESADEILRQTSDPVVRRGAIVWKIETTTTMLSAMLRSDPVLALADAWGYAVQLEHLLERPETRARFGEFAPVAAAAMAQVEEQFRELLEGIQEGRFSADVEAAVRRWAERYPIEGALYRRPSMDSAVAETLASAESRGSLAALGGLDETTADVMARMDLYTMYLPRLARWEAEVAADDLARGVDPRALADGFERLTRAVERTVAVVEGVPELVARERAVTLAAVSAERIAATADLRAERRAVLDAVREERIATLREVEAIAQRLVDRSSAPLHQAARADLEELVGSVEEMRKRLIVDAGDELDGVVDHAFLRLAQLLLIGAALSGLGVALGFYFLRR